MADAETLLMETSDQNGNEGEEDQNGAEQELMVEQDCQDGQDGEDCQDGQDNGTDGGKIDASKGEEDAGWVFSFSDSHYTQHIWTRLVFTK